MELLVCAWDWLKANLSTEFFAALAAFMSFVVAWRQHVWNKRNHLASVSPFLCDFLQRSQPDHSLTFRIMNKGLGPARLVSYVFMWNDKPISRGKIEEILYGTVSGNFNLYIAEMTDFSALAANDSEVVLSVMLKPNIASTQLDSEDFQRINKLLIANFRLKIEYKSILDSEVLTYKTTPMQSLLKEIQP